MRAGKISSLVLAGFLGAVSATVAMVSTHIPELHDRLHKSSLLLEGALIFAILSLTFLLILFPLGASIDRGLARLRRNIEDSASGDGGAVALSGPRWLRPIVGAYAAAIEQYRDDRRRFGDELRSFESTRAVAETRRRHSEAVLHTLRDAVIVTDVNDRVIMVNEAAASILGLDMDKIVHRDLDDAISLPRLRSLIRKTRKRGEIGALRHDEIRVPLPASTGESDPGATATFDACLMCVEQGENEVGGVVVVLHDLTRMRELSELKNDFVSKASHELRTPLSSIRAYVEMLIDGEAHDDASRHEFYCIIHEEAERLSRLIDNLLNISRIEAGMVQTDKRDILVAPLIDRAVTARAPAARDKNIAVETRIDARDLRVEADRDMVYQVVLNLITNAIKYTPEDGCVKISVAPDESAGTVKIVVEDTGPGIPAEAQSRIFEKFYRYEDTTDATRGTGLGLTLCKHIVETLHDGRIGVESSPGHGARFWFTIPARSDYARTAA